MKKVFAFVALGAAMVFAGQAYAQLSVNAGFTSKTMNQKVQWGSHTGDTTASMGGGFYIGASYNYELTEGIGVSAGLYFNYNSKKTSDEYKYNDGVKLEWTDQYTMMDLNIPILVNYKYAVTDDISVFAFAGPTIQLGLSATNKYTRTWSGWTGYMADENGTKTTTDNLYAKDDGEGDRDKSTSELNRFDLGLTFGLGAQYQAFRFEIGYNLGLLDRSTFKDGTYDGTECKNTIDFNQFFVGVGYVF